MATASIILERPITDKFTLSAALDELLWIDSQLCKITCDTEIRGHLLKYRDFVESHTEVPK